MVILRTRTESEMTELKGVFAMTNGKTKITLVVTYHTITEDLTKGIVKGSVISQLPGNHRVNAIATTYG